jgi:hypothetical protein
MRAAEGRSWPLLGCPVGHDPRYVLNVFNSHISILIIPLNTKLGRIIFTHVEINHLNALNYILLYFSFTMAPACFDKTMPSSGRDYVPF